jgi:hypothetical protein
MRTPFSPASGVRPTVRWGWVSAITLGCLLGLVLATLLGETGSRLGPPDAFDMIGIQAGEP